MRAGERCGKLAGVHTQTPAQHMYLMPPSPHKQHGKQCKRGCQHREHIQHAARPRDRRSSLYRALETTFRRPATAKTGRGTAVEKLQRQARPTRNFILLCLHVYGLLQNRKHENIRLRAARQQRGYCCCFCVCFAVALLHILLHMLRPPAVRTVFVLRRHAVRTVFVLRRHAELAVCEH